MSARRPATVLAAALTLGACQDAPSSGDARILAGMPAPLPAPEDPPGDMDRAKVALGKMLFFDPRLSSTRGVACASCHPIADRGSGTVRTPVAYGVDGRPGARNPPTVWNVGRRTALFWDGRAGSLEAQARGPITNPDEMDMDAQGVERALARAPAYRAAFAAAFEAERRASGRTGIAFDEVVSALAAFERTLVTPDAPFDRACRGEPGVLSASAWRGWRTFQDVGCVACHAAPTFTTDDYFVRFPLRSVPDLEFALGFTRDPGRGGVSPQPNAANTWRVPSLRNVAVTGPYFHNGSVASLDQAVRVMGRAQLATTLTEDQVHDVVAFLESLTGVPPLVPVPALPADE